MSRTPGRRGAGRARRPRRARRMRLREDRPDDAAAPGAERRADRDLLAPPERLREHEVRDVGAGDQEHEADRAEEHEQRRSHVADEVLVQRDDRGAPAFVVLRILRREPGGDGVHLAARGLDGDAFLQPREDPEVVDAADGLGSSGVENERQPELASPPGRPASRAGRRRSSRLLPSMIASCPRPRDRCRSGSSRAPRR